MKKTLVAIAALAATGAFAQVTITGNLDFAGAKISGTQLGSNATTFSTNTGTSSTSAIKFSAVEDLGGGLKATAFYAFDPRTLANDSFAVTEAAATKLTATGLARDEMFVSLSGSFGNVRLGSPNSLGLEASGDSSPLGTAAGSGYAIASGTMMNSVVQTRYNRSIRFDTPTMSGFSASVLYAPGNDVVALDTAAVAIQVPNARKATEFALKYANGPLKVSLTSVQQDDMTNTAGWYSGAGKDNKATSATLLAANYKINNTTLYYGMNTGDRLAAKGGTTWSNLPVESKGSRVAIKQTMGQVDLIASHTTQETTGNATVGGVGDAKAKVTGLRADYNLSKTTAAYMAYEKYDSGIAASSTATLAALTGDRKVVSIGMRKSF